MSETMKYANRENNGTDEVKIISDLGIALSKLSDLKEDIKALDAKITGQYVTVKEHVELYKRVSAIESSLGWVGKIVIGAVIMSLLGVVLLQNK